MLYIYETVTWASIPGSSPGLFMARPMESQSRPFEICRLLNARTFAIFARLYLFLSICGSLVRESA